MTTAASKDNSYIEKHINGQRHFECQLCSRTVGSKRSILKHLFAQHNLSPLKPIKKLYSYDDSIAVPRSTSYRWKSSNARKPLSFEESKVAGCSSSCEGQIANNNGGDTEADTDGDTDGDAASILNTFGGETSSSDSRTTDSLSTTDVSSIVSSENETSHLENSLENAKTKALTLLHCFRKHNLTSSACDNILRIIRHICPTLDSEASSLLSYKTLLSHIPTTAYKELHYCSKCEYVFPEDTHVLDCETENCNGKKKSFMIASVKELLKNLLKAPGIMEDIKQYKQFRQQHADSTTVNDIYSGELYKERMSNSESSSGNLHLTATLNTDGVNLYSSSRVELWPVFMAINELSPSLRFSRENILLIGLWQGKGKPPFLKFIEQISREINLLTNNGFNIEIQEETVTVYLTALCITMDLPAKAGVLNMTLFNGAEACISCEESGIVVRQGRGHSRCYPFRTPDSRFPSRSNASVSEHMNAASVNRRQKGFKGLSGLTFLLQFDLVYGTVPDYMHCILLGIVKTIMNKWFSARESGKAYFVGKALKQISERLSNIKPPYYIERLPRDLEHHYTHFKATEFQAFLLFYALPCLHGILDDTYLQHFALLSEAIFILLGDEISDICLERSEQLLDKFYAQFAELYGEGSCGLNVHNACVHLPTYVRKLGPIWCWSCFAFEDTNSVILQSVHGTGDVVKQALRNQEVALYIRSSEGVNHNVTNSNTLRISHKAENCDIIGSLKCFRNQFSVAIMQYLRIENTENVRKAQRILLNGERFYCSEYSRMKRRNCHAVLYCENEHGLIQYFVLVIHTNLVYAVIKKMNLNNDSWLHTYEAGKQLIPVVLTNCVHVVPVEMLRRTLVFIQIGNGQEAIVVNAPNRHGHAILK